MQRNEIHRNTAEWNGTDKNGTGIYRNKPEWRRNETEWILEEILRDAVDNVLINECPSLTKKTMNVMDTRKQLCLVYLFLKWQ